MFGELYGELEASFRAWTFFFVILALIIYKFWHKILGSETLPETLPATNLEHIVRCGTGTCLDELNPVRLGGAGIQCGDKGRRGWIGLYDPVSHFH